MAKVLRQLGQKVSEEQVHELMVAVSGKKKCAELTWPQFADAVADGRLDELEFAAALDVQNIVIISEDGAHFIFKYIDPSKSLPEEILLRMSEADIDLHDNADKSVACR
jgi:hypothetical protein